VTTSQKLSDVLQFIRGVTFSPDELVTGDAPGAIACLRTKNIQKELDDSDLIYVPSSVVKREEQALQDCDLLISSANSWELVGKTVRVGKLSYLATAGGFISILRPDRERIDPDYLFRFISWARTQHEIRHLGRQTTNISNLDRERFLELPIPLPPLPTQRHIAKVLEQADHLRRQTQLMETELERLAQVLFLDMFGSLFANPKQWPVVDLGSLIEQGPKNGLYKHADDYGSGTPIIRIDNFYAGELTDSTNFKRVSLTEAEQEKFGLENHSILINRVNSPEYLGKVALVENLTELTVFESNMMNFTVDQSRINPVFLVTQLGSQFIREQIRKASKDASNQSSINQGDVRAFRVVVPPIAEQNRFACLVINIRHVRNMGSKRSCILEEAFQSLMQRAFKGELTPKLA